MNGEDAYQFLLKLAEGISETFGSNCETVIHEMDGQTIHNIAFFNGHVSGREVGSTVSIYGADTALQEGDNSQNLELDYINQYVHVHGRQIKSTTIHMRGDDFHYALGINFDITELARVRAALDSVTAVGNELREVIGTGSGELSQIFEDCIERLGISPECMHKDERMQLVRMLRDKGVFEIRRSVPWVASRMNVSKYTIYKYLKDIGGTIDEDRGSE